MKVAKEVTIIHYLQLFTTTIIQPKLEAELCPDTVFVIVSSHQIRRRYRCQPLGEEKGWDTSAVHRHEV